MSSIVRLTAEPAQRWDWLPMQARVASEKIINRMLIAALVRGSVYGDTLGTVAD